MALSIGTKAPDFSLPTKTAEGPKRIQLSDNFGKKNTLLLFFPMAFTGFLPALWLLGVEPPYGLPDWAGWCAPLAAAWTWLLALVSWRLGVRHYQGGGG